MVCRKSVGKYFLLCDGLLLASLRSFSFGFSVNRGMNEVLVHMGPWDSYIADRNAAAKIVSVGTCSRQTTGLYTYATKELINITAFMSATVRGLSLFGKLNVHLFRYLGDLRCDEHVLGVEQPWLLYQLDLAVGDRGRGADCPCRVHIRCISIRSMASRRSDASRRARRWSRQHDPFFSLSSPGGALLGGGCYSHGAHGLSTLSPGVQHGHQDDFSSARVYSGAVTSASRCSPHHGFICAAFPALPRADRGGCAPRPYRTSGS